MIIQHIQRWNELNGPWNDCDILFMLVCWEIKKILIFIWFSTAVDSTWSFIPSVQIHQRDSKTEEEKYTTLW